MSLHLWILWLCFCVEGPPDRPTNVVLSIVSRKSLLVSFFPPSGQTTADIVGYIGMLNYNISSRN